MLALTLAVLLLQAPGDGWVLAPVPPRETHTLYWDLFDTTETWVSLIPDIRTGAKPLVRLIFQAFFPGKERTGSPRLVLRALGLPLTVVTQFSLRLTLDADTVDLGAACAAPDVSATACRFLYPVGEQASANGISVALDASLLERLAAARQVTGTALGFPIMLSAEDCGAIRVFLNAVRGRQRLTPARTASPRSPS